MKIKKIAVVLSNGAAGAENQAFGFMSRLSSFLASFVHLEQHRLDVQLTKGYQYLPPQLHVLANQLGSPWKGFQNETLEYFKQYGYPDLVVASGRTTVALNCAIRQESQQHTYSIQIQHPRVSLDYLDLIITPQHDFHPNQPVPQNVITTLGTMNGITQEKLKDAFLQWQNTFQFLPSFKMAVLIGGSCRGYRLDKMEAIRLANSLVTLQSQFNLGIMVSFSRRTSLENREIIQTRLRSMVPPSDLYIWDGQGDNPYLGLLAHASVLLVTADSISMVSEAIVCGKPVHVFDPNHCMGKFKRFYQKLLEKNAILSNYTLEKNSILSNYTLDDAEKPSQESKHHQQHHETPNHEISTFNETEKLADLVAKKLLKRWKIL